MNSIRLRFIIFISLLLVNCKKDSETITGSEHPDLLTIELKSVIGNKNLFEEVFTDFPVYTLKKKYPEYYNKKFKNIASIPKLDSFLVVTRNFQFEPFVIDLFKKGVINQGQFLKKSKRKKLKDTAPFPEKPIKFQLNILSGFKGNEQIIIPDLNNDNNFNDESFIFNSNFRIEHKNSSALINEIPLIDPNYQVYIDGEVQELNRKVQLYPYSNHIHSYLLSDNTLNKVLNKYTLMLRLKDHRVGVIEVNKTKYEIVLQGLSKELFQIIIKPDSLTHSEVISNHRTNFTYALTDSVNLGSMIYRIEDLNGNLSELILRKTNLDAKDFRGHRIGETIDDYSLESLENENIYLSEVLDKNKRYTLLDFWGTWCAPCKENLPDLKELHNTYVENINFVSIAFDEDIQQVKEFTINHKMEWSHFFVDRKNRRETIISGLKVGYYPTFILMDQDFKIIHRGGTDSFQELSKFLKKELSD